MWVELASALIGIAALLGVGLWFARVPESAIWHDVEVPSRVTRGQSARLRIEVAVYGPSTWVNAVGERRQKVKPILEWPIETARRGKFLVGPSRLEFADLFGLRVRTLATRALTQVVVVPRIVAVPQLVQVTPISSGVLDERPGSEQFHSLREYVPGDPMRLIHWRSSARAGKLMVRRLVDTTVPTLLVVLDLDKRSYNKTASQFSSFDADAFEAAVDLAASCVLAHCTSAQRVLLTTTRSGEHVIEVSPRDRDAALDWLAMIEPSDTTLPMRIQELASARGLGHIALITGGTSVLDSASRAWGQVAEVTTLRS
ncbi:MAG: DUF58 domain-containing protein [Actinomycetota bacterium]|nr:DUF58 domain-containing protein [Actinomycetota bacterium]